MMCSNLQVTSIQKSLSWDVGEFLEMQQKDLVMPSTWEKTSRETCNALENSKNSSSCKLIWQHDTDLKSSWLIYDPYALAWIASAFYYTKSTSPWSASGSKQGSRFEVKQWLSKTMFSSVKDKPALACSCCKQQTSIIGCSNWQHHGKTSQLTHKERCNHISCQTPKQQQQCMLSRILLSKNI